ncbi:alpha/beta hydrolase [Thermoleophilia bacterium SCSIO 60948]|nr:alpha/beta hydrolase [Thermoleophilia bacterium SCSIO 60948]
MPTSAEKARRKLARLLSDSGERRTPGPRRRPAPTPYDGPDPYGNPDPTPAWLEVDWQQHLRQITLEIERPSDGEGPYGQVPINYVDIGEGDVVLLVHGISGCWQNFLETIPAAAERHRVVALDLPGFGASPMPDWDVSIPAYARVVTAFADALELEKPTLVGNSMGGFISVEAVLRSPDRYRQLILLAAAGISSATVSARPVETAVRVLQALTPFALEWQKRTMRRPRLRALGFEGVFLHPRKLRYELLVEQLRGGTGRPAFLPAMESMLGYDVTDELGSILLPTTVVCGRQDRIVPPRDAAIFTHRIPNARLDCYEDCGHLPQLEHPIRFNRLLEELLVEHAGSSATGQQPSLAAPTAS